MAGAGEGVGEGKMRTQKLNFSLTPTLSHNYLLST